MLCMKDGRGKSLNLPINTSINHKKKKENIWIQLLLNDSLFAVKLKIGGEEHYISCHTWWNLGHVRPNRVRGHLDVICWQISTQFFVYITCQFIYLWNLNYLFYSSQTNDIKINLFFRDFIYIVIKKKKDVGLTKLYDDKLQAVEFKLSAIN